MTNEMEPSKPADVSVPNGTFNTDTWYTVSFRIRPTAFATDWDKIDAQYLANLLTGYFSGILGESTASMWDFRNGTVATFEAKNFTVEPNIEISDDDLNNLLGGSQDEAGD